MNGDGQPPDCQVALCPRPASYRTVDADGEPVYVCEPHRPFAALIARPRWYTPPSPDLAVVVPLDLAEGP